MSANIFGLNFLTINLDLVKLYIVFTKRFDCANTSDQLVVIAVWNDGKLGLVDETIIKLKRLVDK